MLVSRICKETNHKTSTKEPINVAEKCFSVKHLTKTFLGISGPLSWIIYRNFTNNNNWVKPCIIHVSLYWDFCMWMLCAQYVCLFVWANFSVCVFWSRPLIDKLCFWVYNMKPKFLCFSSIFSSVLSYIFIRGRYRAITTSLVVLLLSEPSTGLWAINLISSSPISPPF